MQVVAKDSRGEADHSSVYHDMIEEMAIAFNPTAASAVPCGEGWDSLRGNKSGEIGESRGRGG